jgi:hypothetical protein
VERHYIIPFSQMPTTRAAISRGDAITPDELESFAISMTSPSDVTLLRNLLLGSDGDRAGWTCLALYAAGGIGDLSTEIRRWLFIDDNGDRIHTAGPVVLASSVTDLFDATAFRVLLEFAGRYTVRLELEPLLKSFGDEASVCALLKMPRSDQINKTLASKRLTENRKAWLLRTYIDSPLVQQYLYDSARGGSLEAVASLFFVHGSLPWTLFERIRATEQSEVRILSNLVQENLARGAIPDELLSGIIEQNPALKSDVGDAL